jgi:phage antirepressor YoqD-like protein
MEIMALALQIQQNTIEAQHRQIEDMAPKAEYCDEEIIVPFILTIND